MFVQRNEAGKIVGAFANLQPGFGEEELSDDDVDLAAFFESLQPSTTLQERIDSECQKQGIANEITLEGLMGGMLAFAMVNGMTAEQFMEINPAFKKGMELRALFAQWRAHP